MTRTRIITMLAVAATLMLAVGWQAPAGPTPILAEPVVEPIPAPPPVEIQPDPIPYIGEAWFSTEIGFTRVGPDGTYQQVTDGDLLSTRRCVVRTNRELTARLGFMPIVADMGLDAVTYPCNVVQPHPVPEGDPQVYPYCPILFSLELSGFSETLGPISHGDLLSSDGRIVRTNEELVEAFRPLVATVDGFGLDAVHAGVVSSAEIGFLFSVETNFTSGTLGQVVTHGDLLAEGGFIYRTHAQLLRNFRPYDPYGHHDDTVHRNYGLDAVYVHRNGEVWFSVERGFYDRRLGWVSDGDLISEHGYIVRRNLDLLRTCAPLEEIANFGLDAVEIRRWLSPIPYVEEYWDSGCLPGSGEDPMPRDQYPWCGGDEFDYEVVEGVLVVIHKNATYNCCPDEIPVYVDVQGNTIRMMEEEVLTYPCTCLCCYDVGSKVANLVPGTYTLEYCWYDYEEHEWVCRTMEVVIP